MEKYICTLTGIDSNNEVYSLFCKVVEIKKNDKPMFFIESGKGKGMFVKQSCAIGTIKNLELK